MSAIDSGFRYHAYGLRVHASRALEGLVEATGRCQLEIRFEPSPPSTAAGSFGDHHPSASATSWYRHDGVAWFRVRDGREIVVWAEPGADPSLVWLSLLGPAMGLALHQRGRFLLHASAVAIDGEAVVFVGPNGAGKSSVAAGLLARGHRLLSDDLTVVDTDDARPAVVPSFPFAKLWPDSARMAAIDPASLPRLHPEIEKRGYRPRGRFARTPCRLARIYLLRRGDEVAQVATMPTTAGFRTLLRHFYGARYGVEFLRSLDGRAHFERVARLTAAVPVRELARPDWHRCGKSFAASIERAVIADLSAEPRPGAAPAETTTHGGRPAVSTGPSAPATAMVPRQPS
ncbi:MAG: hypothetical protein H6982_09525 [Chromatiales bacterium]|nr:hypothetical protein [Chromatiales bacterium]